MIPAKVKPGDPFKYPADFFNLQVDMADRFQRGELGKQSEPAKFRGLTQGQWCYVKNSSGADRNQFAALKVTGVLFSPSDRLIEFKTNWALTVGTTGDDTQPIAILIEPIKSGKLGRAIVDGIAPVKLQVNSSTDRYAILDGTSVGRLKTDPSLGAEVIYKAGSSGEQWALVRVGQQNRLYKPLVRFTLAAALATTDASKTATIASQYGPGLDNPNTSSGAITVYNLADNTGSAYVFEGDSGDAGYGAWDSGNNYRILNMECP